MPYVVIESMGPGFEKLYMYSFSYMYFALEVPNGFYSAFQIFLMEKNMVNKLSLVGADQLLNQGSKHSNINL